MRDRVMRLLLAIAGALVLAAPPLARARGHSTAGAPGPGSAGRGGGAGTAARGGGPGATSASASCPAGGHHPSGGRPDEQWEVARRAIFQNQTPCPSTGKITHGVCPGYEIIDVPPASRGQPWTLRWGTPEDAERARQESPWLTR